MVWFGQVGYGMVVQGMVQNGKVGQGRVGYGILWLCDIGIPMDLPLHISWQSPPHPSTMDTAMGQSWCAGVVWKGIEWYGMDQYRMDIVVIQPLQVIHQLILVFKTKLMKVEKETKLLKHLFLPFDFFNVFSLYTCFLFIFKSN